MCFGVFHFIFPLLHCSLPLYFLFFGQDLPDSKVIKCQESHRCPRYYTVLLVSVLHQVLHPGEPKPFTIVLFIEYRTIKGIVGRKPFQGIVRSGVVIGNGLGNRDEQMLEVRNGHTKQVTVLEYLVDGLNQGVGKGDIDLLFPGPPSTMSRMYSAGTWGEDIRTPLYSCCSGEDDRTRGNRSGGSA